jgi:phenylacetate-CoA ligase
VYYRKLFSQVGFDPWSDFDFDDFGRLPVLDRQDIYQAGHALVSGSVARSQLRKESTGGTTGQPTELWIGPEERGWQESGFEYYMQRLGVPWGARIGLLWGHHLDPVASDRLRDRLRDLVTNTRWFDCFRLSAVVLARYHRELADWQPRCVIAYASALGALAEEVRTYGRRPNYPTRCFVTGAEKLMPHHRSLIQSVFGRPVYERYGGRDIGLVGFQMDSPRTLDFEVDWANVLVEPETASDKCAILVTKLHGDGMPMIRYRVGDIGRFPMGSRPGHQTFILHEVLGRDVERIWLDETKWVHGNEFPHMMKDYPVREFQVVQHADLSVTIRVVPRSDFSDRDSKSILATVCANIPGHKVHLEFVEEIPRTVSHKLRPVISQVDGRGPRM